MFQQGDVLLFAGISIPKQARVLGHTRLAEGEATGHAHVACGVSVELLEEGGNLYLSAPKGAEIKHEEHHTIAVPPGTYRVGRVREYDHFAEEARQVAD